MCYCKVNCCDQFKKLYQKATLCVLFFHHAVRVDICWKWGAKWIRLHKPLMISLNLYSRLWYSWITFLLVSWILLLWDLLDVNHLCLVFCLIASDTSPTCHTKQNLQTWSFINMMWIGNLNDFVPYMHGNVVHVQNISTLLLVLFKHRLIIKDLQFEWIFSH